MGNDSIRAAENLPFPQPALFVAPALTCAIMPKSSRVRIVRPIPLTGKHTRGSCRRPDVRGGEHDEVVDGRGAGHRGA